MNNSSLARCSTSTWCRCTWWQRITVAWHDKFGDPKKTHTLFWAPEKLWNFLCGIGLPHFCWADDLLTVLYLEFHGIPASWVGDDRSNLDKQTFWTSNDHASSGTVRELQVSIAEGQTQQGVVEEGQWKHPRGPANIPRKNYLQKPLSPRQSQTQLRCHHCKWQWRNIMEHHLLQRRCFVFWPCWKSKLHINMCLENTVFVSRLMCSAL